MNETKENEHIEEQPRTGVSFSRYFTARLEAGKTPYDEVALGTAHRHRSPTTRARCIFEQRDVEVPADWSQTATNIVASKYFHGKLGSPDRERSVAQLVHRVVDTITEWGTGGRLLPAPREDAENFRSELAHLCSPRRPASTRRSGSTWA